MREGTRDRVDSSAYRLCKRSQTDVSPPPISTPSSVVVRWLGGGGGAGGGDWRRQEFLLVSSLYRWARNLVALRGSYLLLPWYRQLGIDKTNKR